MAIRTLVGEAALCGGWISRYKQSGESGGRFPGGGASLAPLRCSDCRAGLLRYFVILESSNPPVQGLVVGSKQNSQRLTSNDDQLQIS
ncbi:hypothetical protein QUB80_16170 [Chlorogloeopsis sp. ULAP01]|uniref:hypothetical protein n=1 Tax=Chlorogloeopsis sp. ULAP01 TaxID=3056483 RepID=UPI0025AAD73A|nr:hypothetical protein [Chlorogloeopsis sp. ULAP01]MDM9382241.1 hypothetical protein [Chlorogloeopsis sp. ULAP01]